jgi:predicted helicase
MEQGERVTDLQSLLNQYRHLSKTDWKKGTSHDTGIDLMAKTHAGELHEVQCKLERNLNGH